MLPPKRLCLPEYHRWLPFSVRSASEVAGDQRPVQGQIGQAIGLRLHQGFVQIRGLGGQHVDALVQVPVGGGLGQSVIGGQGCYAGAVAVPAQHQFRLGPGRARPLERAQIVGLAVAVQ